VSTTIEAPLGRGELEGTCAKLGGERDAVRGDVGSHHRHPASQERERHEQALGADADNEGGIRDRLAEPTQGSFDDRHRLNRDEVLGGTAAHCPRVAARDHESLCDRAGTVHPDRLAVRTGRVRPSRH
jgi:hypothetical protein